MDYKDQDDRKRAIGGEIDEQFSSRKELQELNENECRKLIAIFDDFNSSLNTPNFYDVVKNLYSTVKDTIGDNFVEFHEEYIGFIDYFFQKFRVEQPNTVEKFLKILYKLHKSDEALDYLKEKVENLFDLFNYFLSFNSPAIEKATEICLTFVRHLDDYSLLLRLNPCYLFNRLEDRISDFKMNPTFFLILKVIALTDISEDYIIALTEFLSGTGFLCKPVLKSLTDILLIVFNSEIFDDSPLYHMLYDVEECPRFFVENITGHGFKYIAKLVMTLDSMHSGYITVVPIERVYESITEALLLTSIGKEGIGFGISFLFIDRYSKHDKAFLLEHLYPLQEMLFGNKEVVSFNTMLPAVPFALTLFQEQIINNETDFDFHKYLTFFEEFMEGLSGEELQTLAMLVSSLHEKLKFVRNTEGASAIEGSSFVEVFIDRCEDEGITDNTQVRQFIDKLTKGKEEED